MATLDTALEVVNLRRKRMVMVPMVMVTEMAMVTAEMEMVMVTVEMEMVAETAVEMAEEMVEANESRR